jgi:hypothetical protein
VINSSGAKCRIRSSVVWALPCVYEFLSLPVMKVNTLPILTPRAVAITIMATEINDAIKAYSIAVAPFSSFKNLLNLFI